MVLSIGIFFSLMIVGLAARLPKSLFAGLTSHGVASGAAHQVANLPPVGSLFAAFLGYNPIKNLLGPSALTDLSAHDKAVLTGKEFFPHLIAGPFHHGLVIVFTMAIAMSLIAAVASVLRGKRFVYDDTADTPPAAGTAAITTAAGEGIAEAPIPAAAAPIGDNGEGREPIPAGSEQR
jgi:hypothetical protein